MLVLGIESTCDETAAAVVADGVDVRGNVVSSQVELHARYRGVVPEIASRAHIENILPVLKESLAQAGAKLGEIDAVAVSQRPGLIGSLLIGVTAAKTLAWSMGKPLVGVDHVHAHLYSVNLAGGTPSFILPLGTGGGDEGGEQLKGRTPAFPPPPVLRGRVGEGVQSGADVRFPAVGLVCSGGHTALYRLGDWLDVELVGTTLDDAVGEAYDKGAAILGLGYPGGPLIDSLAQTGDPKAIKFPRSTLGRESLDFSFSGLKTALLYHIRGYQGRERDAKKLSHQELADVAASFQAACVDVLVEKIRRAARKFSAKSVIVGGGVSANRGLRATLAKFDRPVYFPPLKYCTDNAAMIAALGYVLLQAGRTSGLEMDAITHSQFADVPD
jgi:N6-L-threonylcarbamoyladenine synthase